MLGIFLAIVAIIVLFYGGAWFGIRALALAAYPVVALGAWLRGESAAAWGRHAWTDLRLAYLGVILLMVVVGALLG